MDSNKHLLYLHVYNWPLNNQLPVTGITRKPVKAYVLRDKLKSPLAFSHNDVFTQIELPKDQPDPLISVVVLEYDQKPQITDGLVAKTVDGGYALMQQNSASEEGERILKSYDKGGTVPPHCVVQDTYQSTWKIYVDQPGELIVDVSYSFQGEKPNGTIKVKASDSELKLNVSPTELTVGEPNRNWHIDNFTSHRLGTINFPKAGIYEISMDIDAKKDKAIKFQWLWLKMK